MTEWAGVDTHVHLGDYADAQGELLAARADGIRLVVGTVLASEFRRLRAQLVESEALALGLGVHPMHAHLPQIPRELEVFDEEFAHARWINEIGLDGFFAHEGGATMTQQRRVFEHILSRDLRDRLLSVHSRDAEQPTIDLLLDASPGAVVMHWFDGDPQVATRGIDAGWYFSVNSFMVRSAAHVALLRWLPLDRIVIETDGPTTTMPDGTPCRPVHVLEIADVLARIRGTDAAVLRRQVVANADALERSVPPRD